MKVELELTKNDLGALRRFLGLKTKVPPTTCLKSLLRLVVDDPDQLENILYEKRFERS